MKGIQILTEKNKKEVKEHGSYTFPVQVSPEAIQSYEQHSFMWHWHPEIELTWFVSGQMEYVVNDQRYIISEGEGIFCNSNALHAGYMIDDQDCNYISVTFHPKFIYGYENSILQTKYVDFITSNEFWSSLVLKPEIPWQNEIIEYIKEIYTLPARFNLLPMPSFPDMKAWRNSRNFLTMNSVFISCSVRSGTGFICIMSRLPRILRIHRSIYSV